MLSAAGPRVPIVAQQGLGLDWRLGAEWFACTLADHDWSVNTLNWAYNSGARWVAAAAITPCTQRPQPGARAASAGLLARRAACGPAATQPPMPCLALRRPRPAAGVGHDPRDRTFRTVSQGLRYDPEARLIAAWCPELARLPAAAAHQPWAAPPEDLQAAGVRLGPASTAADQEQQAGQQQQQQQQAPAGDGMRWYPLPLVDPSTQVAKGPRPSKQRGSSSRQTNSGADPAA